MNGVDIFEIHSFLSIFGQIAQDYTETVHFYKIPTPGIR